MLLFTGVNNFDPSIVGAQLTFCRIGQNSFDGQGEQAQQRLGYYCDSECS